LGGLVFENGGRVYYFALTLVLYRFFDGDGAELQGVIITLHFLSLMPDRYALSGLMELEGASTLYGIVSSTADSGNTRKQPNNGATNSPVKNGNPPKNDDLSPVRFAPRPSLKDASQRGKRLLSVRVLESLQRGSEQERKEFTLALYSEDHPESIAREFCTVFSVSEADCRGLIHILFHALKSVRAYLYTGVPELPKEERIPHPWNKTRPKYPKPSIDPSQGACGPPKARRAPRMDPPTSLRPPAVDPALELKRMNRREGEFQQTMREDGPKVFRSPLTKFQYGHFHRCTACEQQNAYDASIASSSVNIGTAKQLLVDDVALEGVCGMQRSVGEAEKMGIVLSPDKPWEGGSFGAYFSVHHGGNKHGRAPWNMWYASWNKGQAFAESQDGLKWTKPDLPSDLDLGIEGGVATRRRPVTIWNNNKDVRFREEKFAIPKKSNFVGTYGAAFTVSKDMDDEGEEDGFLAGFECQTLHIKILQWVAAVDLEPDTSKASFPHHYTCTYRHSEVRP